VRPLWRVGDHEQGFGERAPALALPRLREVIRANARNPSLSPEDGHRGDHPRPSGGAAPGQSARRRRATGHNDETIATWIKHLDDYAEAITDLLARELHLSEVELNELWSFVGRKGDSGPY
jgi:hypothetical protein